MDRKRFTSDLNNLEFLISMTVLKINNDEEVDPEVFDKFEKLADEYLSSHQELDGTHIRAFTGSYRRVLTIVKRLTVLERMPVERLNKIVGYQESICEIFNNDTSKLKDSISNEVKEINYWLA